ncbi:hypothetical protein OAM01_03180, partial [bacterium]|nr:hypothetical protein [bacterium]
MDTLLLWFEVIMKARFFTYWIACLCCYTNPIGMLLSADVPLQAFSEQVRRLDEAMQFLGIPLSQPSQQKLTDAIETGEVTSMESVLDTLVLFEVDINPESRVKVQKGSAKPELNQGGYAPFLVKVINQATVTTRLNVASPQAGQVFGGMTPLSARRMQRESHDELEDPVGDASRILDLSFYDQPPLTTHLSGLELEYKLLWIYAA